ncbi:TPA: hypothetical protein EYP66_13280, partial [Candidatus Poribacteria bacterium]|nr:hypothetical protein [Candidatus Poribacteria bacterium]
ADIIQFARDAIARFGNRQLEHTNYQVAMYGTEKVKDRLIPSIIRYMEKTGDAPKRLALAVAILLRYVTGFKQGKGIDTRGNEVEGVLGINERGETYFIDDPRATTISNALKMNLSRAESEPILDGILGDREMFRVNLHDYDALAQRIKEDGLEATLENFKRPVFSEKTGLRRQ